MCVLQGVILTNQIDLHQNKVKEYEISFYKLNHGKKQKLFKKCERFCCKNQIANKPNHHYCCDCMIDSYQRYSYTINELFYRK